MQVFFITWPFIIENACLAKNKSETHGRRRGALERSELVERVIPRYQHPPNPLFGWKTTEKGQEGTFQKYFFRHTRSGLRIRSFQIVEISRAFRESFWFRCCWIVMISPWLSFMDHFTQNLFCWWMCFRAVSTFKLELFLLVLHFPPSMFYLLFVYYVLSFLMLCFPALFFREWFYFVLISVTSILWILTPSGPQRYRSKVLTIRQSNQSIICPKMSVVEKTCTVCSAHLCVRYTCARFSCHRKR